MDYNFLNITFKIHLTLIFTLQEPILHLNGDMYNVEPGNDVLYKF